MLDKDAHDGIFPGDYPTQRKSRDTSGTYSGELRGFYPDTSGTRPAGSGYWQPTWSQYRKRPGGHGGVDIYAPYAPTPLEQPVVALRGGALICRSGAIEPNGLGNRAKLTIKLDDGSEHWIQYGHLSRFEGRNRTVKAGDVIGYAGCSGNANDSEECTTVGDAHVNAGHIHLMRIGKEKWDPEEKLGLTLDRVNIKKTGAKDWVSENGGAEDFPKWTESDPDGSHPRLSLEYEMHWWRVKGDPKPLPAPFTPIEFADKRLLSTTRSFYKNCATRLGDPNPSLGSAVKKDLKEFFGQRIEAAQKAFVETETLKQIDALIAKQGVGEAPDTLIGFDGNGKPDQYAEFAMRHLARLNLMLWYLCGGQALELLGANAAGSEGKLRNALKEEFKYKKDRLEIYRTYRPYYNTKLPECGAGVGGTAWLSGCRHGCSALHNTHFKVQPDDPDGDWHWIESVTFGAGSLRHATVSAYLNSPEFVDEANKDTVATYLADLRAAFSAVKKVHRVVHANSISLSGEAKPKITKRAIAAFVDAILRKAQPADPENGVEAKEAGALEAIRTVQGHLSEKLAKAFIPAAVKSNVAVFDEIYRRAKGKEDGVPLSPVMIMAWAEKPPAPPKKPDGDAAAQADAEGAR